MPLRTSPLRHAANAGGALLLLASLAACSNEPAATAPRASVTPKLAVAGASSGRYVVGAKGNGFSANFNAKVAALGGTVLYRHDGAGLAVVTGLDDASAASLGGSSDVSEVQADADFTLDTPRSSGQRSAGNVSANSQANPAGAIFNSWQWDMAAISAPAAWSAGKLGSSSVTAAIIDTGIDYDDFDLNGLVDLSRSASFVPSDDAIATTYFPSRNVISDFNGHGSNVAQTVSSKALAFAGVTSKTTLIGVKVLSRTGSGAISGVLLGVLWAADHGADVANMSLGGSYAKAGNGRFLSFTNRVFSYANRKGMLVVVSAGNAAADMDHDGNTHWDYCNQTHVICVAATGPTLAAQFGTPAQDQPTFYTNFGRSAISVAAPGGNADLAGGLPITNWPWGPDFASWVWSFCSKTTLAGLTAGGVPILAGCQSGTFISGYIGTSQAAPHVTGLAALLIAETGKGKPLQIKAMIEKSADDLGQRGTDPFYGKGRINVKKAVGL